MIDAVRRRVKHTWQRRRDGVRSSRSAPADRVLYFRDDSANPVGPDDDPSYVVTNDGPPWLVVTRD